MSTMSYNFKCEICCENTNFTFLPNGRCNYCSKSVLHSHNICRNCRGNSETAKNKNDPKKRDGGSKNITKK